MTSWRICHAFGWQYDFCSRHQTRSYIRECSVPELSGGSKKEGPKGRRGWSYNKVASSVEGSINRECTVCISLPTLPASLVPQTVKNLPAARETRVWSLDWEDPMEKGMATHSSILAWRIPWMEEPGRLYIVHGVAKSWARLSDLHFFLATFPESFLLSDLVLKLALCASYTSFFSSQRDHHP